MAKDIFAFVYLSSPLAYLTFLLVFITFPVIESAAGITYSHVGKR